MLKFLSLAPLLAGIALLPGRATADDVYRVHFSADLSAVAVEACFEDNLPGQLQRGPKSGRYLVRVHAGDFELPSDADSDQLEIPPLAPDSCLEWEIDLAQAGKTSDFRDVQRFDGSLVTRTDLWFWQDPQREPPRVFVTLQPEWSVSAPWEEHAVSGDEIVFRPEATPASWSSRFAIGKFRSKRVEVPGTELRLAILGDLDDGQAAKLEHWIEESARSVAAVFSRFPDPLPQVLVIATDPRWGRQREPVPWAHVMRGGGMAAEFFVDPGMEAEKFVADWTATHELSHMLLPYVSRQDRWLSEGVASYYQNVLRARDGRLTEVQAWQKLHAGFQRGQVKTGSSETARTRKGGIMRTYWGGAAMMLKADAQLRASSHGRQSLDTALAALQDCCFDPGKRWRAKEMFAQLDRLTGFSIFTDLYREFERTGLFPDVSATYAQLGLVPGAGQVAINGDAPWGRIRHYIMNGSPAPADHQVSGGTR